MKKSYFPLLLVLFLAAGAHQAQAQAGAFVGPRAGFDIVGDVDDFFLGADGRLELPGLPIVLNGAFDFYFTEGNADFVQLSLNALYEFGVDNRSFTPYGGLGLGLSRAGSGLFRESGSKFTTGLNLLGGARFGAGNLRPFVQAQITFGDVDLFTVGGGLLFNVGR